jgi:GT2 family glycosyltransferase
MNKVKFAVATRVSADEFYKKTATGRSLDLYRFPFMEVHLFPNNTAGLPSVYNTVIRTAEHDPSILIFAHDDLHIIDFYWIDQVLTGLNRFQLIGLAGNKRRAPYQAGWMFLDKHLRRDERENLSGTVGHGAGFPPQAISVYGPANQQVKLLDGLFLAAYSTTFAANGMMFDERFDFHFYDLDICRQAEQKNLSCGTIPMSVIHESGGNFGSDAWRRAYIAYIDKWGS